MIPAQLNDKVSNVHMVYRKKPRNSISITWDTQLMSQAKQKDINFLIR